LIDLLRARGYDVAKKEQAEPLTEQKVRDLVRETLDEADHSQEEKPSEETFAANYRDALVRSRSRWFGEGEEDPDAAA
jgi:hypothetical protein